MHCRKSVLMHLSMCLCRLVYYSQTRLISHLYIRHFRLIRQSHWKPDLLKPMLNQPSCFP